VNRERAAWTMSCLTWVSVLNTHSSLNRSSLNCLQEKVARAEVAGFEQQRPLRLACCEDPRNSWCCFRSDDSAAHFEGRDDGTGCFATGHDQAANVAGDEALRNEPHGTFEDVRR